MTLARLVGLFLALAPPLAVDAQPIPRIGYLCAVTCAGPRWTAFVESLAALGYVDGRSTAIVYSPETTDIDRLQEAAADLVRLKVDVIFAAGDVQAARAAQQATHTIPIVMAVSGDPVGLGLIASLARPGANLTGITYLEDELGAKQIELLKEVVPTLSRVGALVDSGDAAALQRVAHLDTAARLLGLRLVAGQARALTTFDDVFGELSRGGPGALVIVSSPNHFFQRSRLAALAIRRRLVAVASRGLGLTIPPSVLARADEVIQ
jgi:putative ABC transport system substrate-binding protein